MAGEVREYAYLDGWMAWDGLDGPGDLDSAQYGNCSDGTPRVSVILGVEDGGRGARERRKRARAGVFLGGQPRQQGFDLV
jgi:hypothetical protein